MSFQFVYLSFLSMLLLKKGSMDYGKLPVGIYLFKVSNGNNNLTNPYFIQATFQTCFFSPFSSFNSKKNKLQVLQWANHNSLFFGHETELCHCHEMWFAYYNAGNLIFSSLKLEKCTKETCPKRRWNKIWMCPF